ncbi:MAG TPA: phosphotransferase family protein [Candidatus Binataceae bacterium]|nr:phosphotransferase family protein [Candidatus Binataceae bacterium]
MAASIEEITPQITALVRAKTGDHGASVRDISPLPGHAGFGYSLVLDRTTPGGISGKLVLRVAPEGTRIAGPADVMRQARIMESLADTEVAVPPIYWYGDEAEFFGRPYFVAGFVQGFRLVDVPNIARAEARKLARCGVETMAALHRVDWRPRRSAWGGDPTPLSEEMKRLDHLLDRPTLDPATVARAPELREKLRATIPDTRVGIVHGDFQFSNIMFNDGRVAALIDWEISLLGPTLLDLGWICFFADPASFLEDRSQTSPAPLAAEEIVEIYSAVAGFPVSMEQVRWFRAFAGYRFGVITCFNLMLHRRGKRHDPEWERIGLSAPRMFEHALELLG